MNYTAAYMKKLAKTARSLRDIHVFSDKSKTERINAKRAAARKAYDYAEMVAWTKQIDTSAIMAEMREIIVEADDDEAFRTECISAMMTGGFTAPRKKTGWEAEVAVMIASH